MHFKEDNGNVIIEDIEYFKIKNILRSGQIFRYNKSDDHIYTIIASGRVIKIRQDSDKVIFYDCSIDEFEKQWVGYLALDEDYSSIIDLINTDDIMQRALEYGSGIRILKQDLWEMMISFIVSQNNNIPRITKIIQALCENYGSKIVLENNTHYLFPTSLQLQNAAKEELKQIGLGYRDSYIIDAVQKINWGEIDLAKIKLSDTVDARNELLKIKGVGGKVADCILLFGASRYEVCPHDVWVKRIFREKYHVENICEKTGYKFAEKKWGKYAGIAQQYLFHCERENYKQPNK